MVTNSQITNSIKKSKRSSKRPWLVLLIAALLITIPVLPLKFFGIPGPDFSKVKDLGSKMMSQLKGGIAPVTKSSHGRAHEPTKIKSQDVELLDKTAQTLLRRISDKPNDPSLHNRLGLTLMELGENHTSVSHFKQAVKLSKTEISKLKAKANKAKEKKDLTTAAEYITDISRLEVQLAAAHSSLARVYERLGRSEKVIFHLNELDKDVVLSKSGQSSKTSVSLPKKVNDGKSLNPNTVRTLAKANALKEAGRLQESIAEYKKLIEATPKLEVAHFELGLVAQQAHNYWLAENEFKEAIKLNPNSATAHNALGNIYMITERISEAKEEFLKTMALNPKISAAAFSLGNIHAAKGEYEEARTAFQKACEAQPTSAYAHNNLATMCSLSGDYQTAIIEFKEAIKLSPDMASAHYGLGIALMNLKKYNQCIPEFQTALKLNPALVDAHNKIAVAKRQRHSF